MKYKLLLLLVGLTSVLYAQGFTNYNQLWGTYVGSQLISEAGDFHKDEQGNIIFVGPTLVHSETFRNPLVYNYYKDFTFPVSDELMFSPNDVLATYIAKFSPEGVLLSARYVPYFIHEVTVTSNHELILEARVHRNDLGTENTWFPSPVFDRENRYPVLMKLNQNLEVVWTTYLPNNVTYFDNSKIVVDEIGNIYGLGETTIESGVATPGAFYTNFTYDLNREQVTKPNNGFIYKLNPNGQIEWCTYYGASRPTSLVLKNNELLVAFEKVDQVADYFPAITPNANQHIRSNSVLAKFNTSTGNRIYATYFGEGEKMYIGSLKDNGDYIYVNGYTQELDNPLNYITANAYQPEFGGGYSDIYLAKLDLNFNVVWGTYFGGTDFDLNGNYYNSELKFLNNHFYIIGISGSSNFMNEGVVLNPSNSGLHDVLISKFNLNGDLVWGTLFGGQNEDYVDNIIVQDDKTFYISGATYSTDRITTTGSHQPNFNIFSNYNALQNHFIAKFGEEKPLSTGDLSSTSLKIYPNPAKDKVYIKGFIHQDSWIEVYNLVGQKVITQKAKSGLSQEIEVQFLPKGTYIIKATDINGKPFQEKLLIN